MGCQAGKPVDGTTSEDSVSSGGTGRGFWVDSKGGNLTDEFNFVKKPLGQGNFGTVHLATDKCTGDKRAVKKLNKKKMKAAGEMDAFKQEVGIMTGLDHPNICRLFSVYEDKKDVMLVLELCTGGELFDQLEKLNVLSEAQAANMMKQTFHAVYYMHNKGICHRDMKADNFLIVKKDDPLETCQIKIIDFGTALRFQKDVPLTEILGTPYYMSPQVLQGSYNQLCDIWSCGVLLYFLLSGYAPFGTGESDHVIIFEKIAEGVPEFDPEDGWGNVSPDAIDLINQLLQYGEEDRCDAGIALNHPWIKKNAAGIQGEAMAQTIVDNFTRFRNANQLKKVAINYIACHLSEEKLAKLRHAFMEIDVNGDGTLTFDEMTAGIAKFDAKVDTNELSRLLHTMDSDGSGSIDYAEFLSAGLDREIFTEEANVKAVFRKFDSDADGKITIADMKRFCLNEHVDGAEQIEETLRKIDVNGDGELDFEEFTAMMLEEDSAFEALMASKVKVGGINVMRIEEVYIGLELEL